MGRVFRIQNSDSFLFVLTRFLTTHFALSWHQDSVFNFSRWTDITKNLMLHILTLKGVVLKMLLLWFINLLHAAICHQSFRGR